MKYKNAAIALAFAAFFFAVPVDAQEKIAGGSLWSDCWPLGDSSAKRIEFDNHLRVILLSNNLDEDKIFKTKDAVKPGWETMIASICDDHMENCRPIKAKLTMSRMDNEAAEGVIEYSEAINKADTKNNYSNKMRFKVLNKDQKGRVRALVICG